MPAKRMPGSPFWFGGLAASMAASFTHPLDLIKVRMQTLASGSMAARPVSVLRSVLIESGVRGLYAGLTASLLRQMTYSLVRLGSYEELKQRIAAKTRRKPNTPQLLLAAGVAGALGGVSGNPADILLVRMISDPIKPPEQRYAYRNAFAGFISLVRMEGMRGLTRGLGPNLTRAILMNVSQVGSYDYFKSALLLRSLPILDYQFRDNVILHVVGSCLAGTVATTICSPADVLKSRLMSSSAKSGLWETFTRSLREEGVKFLFKGWTPAFVRLGPNTVLLFVFLEQLKNWQAYIPALR